MVFTSIPPLLAAILLLYLFAIILDWLPLQGSYGRGMQPELTWEYVQSVAQHSILPALSIVLVTFGYWALGMRGMMVTIEGEDYMTLARAKGLKPLSILYRYSIRNAILPQVTALALGIGSIVGGQILVEVVFQYRGMGQLIFTAIRNQDFSTIQGTSYMIIVTTALAVLILDLIYPLIDPRISYARN
jgi:peptide/nickel transport system permease protein